MTKSQTNMPSSTTSTIMGWATGSHTSKSNNAVRREGTGHKQDALTATMELQADTS
eukprot:CAMPEP_0198129752 /NCGR_PEP_ID=MMETSP1442-20131203/52424_1 /TAXON_ID= /ORGANISM="Craspedostauros australis, Strain CCMP3328" /LENGTH=55 /DNA_ID=CAMNT_0043790207 /DNA_START=414 /DNA_END=577 /DNA_ORIENTATION=-